MSGKIQARHLERRAYVYVRQSTAKQVFENTESTARQYALAERAFALGWAKEAIEIIDADLGHSAKPTQDRSGFDDLTEAVARGDAGAIFAIEVSRLARSSQDWQRLLALFEILLGPRECRRRVLLLSSRLTCFRALRFARARLFGVRFGARLRGRGGVRIDGRWRRNLVDEACAGNRPVRVHRLAVRGHVLLQFLSDRRCDRGAECQRDEDGGIAVSHLGSLVPAPTNRMPSPVTRRVPCGR